MATPLTTSLPCAWRLGVRRTAMLRPLAPCTRSRTVASPDTTREVHLHIAPGGNVNVTLQAPSVRSRVVKPKKPAVSWDDVVMQPEAKALLQEYGVLPTTARRIQRKLRFEDITDLLHLSPDLASQLHLPAPQHEAVMHLVSEQWHTGKAACACLGQAAQALEHREEPGGQPKDGDQQQRAGEAGQGGQEGRQQEREGQQGQGEETRELSGLDQGMGMDLGYEAQRLGQERREEGGGSQQEQEGQQGQEGQQEQQQGQEAQEGRERQQGQEGLDLGYEAQRLGQERREEAGELQKEQPGQQGQEGQQGQGGQPVAAHQGHQWQAEEQPVYVERFLRAVLEQVQEQERQQREQREVQRCRTQLDKDVALRNQRLEEQQRQEHAWQQEQREETRWVAQGRGEQWLARQRDERSLRETARQYASELLRRSRELAEQREQLRQQEEGAARREVARRVAWLMAQHQGSYLREARKAEAARR